MTLQSDIDTIIAIFDEQTANPCLPDDEPWSAFQIWGQQNLDWSRDKVEGVLKHMHYTHLITRTWKTERCADCGQKTGTTALYSLPKKEKPNA